MRVPSQAVVLSAFSRGAPDTTGTSRGGDDTPRCQAGRRSATRDNHAPVMQGRPRSGLHPPHLHGRKGVRPSRRAVIEREARRVATAPSRDGWRSERNGAKGGRGNMHTSPRCRRIVYVLDRRNHRLDGAHLGCVDRCVAGAPAARGLRGCCGTTPWCCSTRRSSRRQCAQPLRTGATQTHRVRRRRKSRRQWRGAAGVTVGSLPRDSRTRIDERRRPSARTELRGDPHRGLVETHDQIPIGGPSRKT